MLNVKKILTKMLPSFAALADSEGVVTFCGLQIQWGTNTQAVSSAQDKTWNTTFGRSFAYKPAVFAQIVGTDNPTVFSVVINDITTTGCTFIRRSGASTSYNCTINWVAIGKAS